MPTKLDRRLTKPSRLGHPTGRQRGSAEQAEYGKLIGCIGLIEAVIEMERCATLSYGAETFFIVG